MKYGTLKTLSIWMLILFGSVFAVGLLGVAASGNPGAATVALYLPFVGVAGLIGRAAGYPDYSSDGLNKLIPVLFASDAREKLYASTCLENITMAGIQGAD